jgi:hypothetical protein
VDEEQEFPDWQWFGESRQAVKKLKLETVARLKRE